MEQESSSNNYSLPTELVTAIVEVAITAARASVERVAAEAAAPAAITAARASVERIAAEATEAETRRAAVEELNRIRRSG